MSCKVLIVDDSAVVRHALRSCIELNPTVTVCGEAENGQVAIDKVKELKPDVVILDWQMPVMNGLEAARHIARFVPKPAMVLLTLHSGDELAKQARAVGIQRVFSKSESLTHLVAWLTTMHRDADEPGTHGPSVAVPLNDAGREY
jgi:DNA-binding NarL/FixJ family response regulator